MKHKKVTNALLKHLGSEKKILNLSKNLQKENQVVFCNSLDVCSLVMSCLAQKAQRPLVVVVDKSSDILETGSLCRELFDGSVFYIYKEKPSNSGVVGFNSDSNYEFERSCYGLINNQPGLYITDKKTLLCSFNTSSEELNKEIEIKIDREIDQKIITSTLNGWGYVSAEHCVGTGTYAVRGGILDVFPPHLNRPIRIEFYDKSVESIRLFDIDSQLSISKRESVVIPKPLGLVSSGAGLAVLDVLKKTGNLLYITQYQKGESSAYNLELYVETFRLPVLKDRVSDVVVGEAVKKHKKIFAVNAKKTDMIGLGGATQTTGPYLKSFSIPVLGLACFVFAAKRNNPLLSDKKLPINVSSKKILGLSEISWGEFLVHQDFGVGRYRGLQTILVGKKTEENIKIEYSKGSFVFVPVDRFSRVHKYVGYGSGEPSLSTLGTGGWEKQKLLTKKSTSVVVGELIKLYASRSNPRGFEYKPDDEILSAVKQNFPYKETPDQQQAISDVLNDLQKPKPMDRLLYGDVGFGKTEVALRAAVSVVSSGRCVFFLAPTTVLSDQHFITCKNRLNPLGINAELLSRFRTKKEQKVVLSDLKNKKIDVLVGTHRLLSDDVVTKNLGLLIVDEEHRFGVKNKEKIKALKVGVDVLTLTATPIPRTLQQSLVGLKDTSKIETPPSTRLPIKTHVRRFSWRLILSSIRDELTRGGQVYFVNNDIKSLSFYQEKLVSSFPNHNVGVAHSKMSTASLEKSVLGFFSGDVDVLVCTSIVESGLDIPNANTIIINNAHRFGLSQLYQIRGRVGRGVRQAFCFLCIPKKHILSPNAFERLKSIEHNTSLGSGYSVAMKDLEIRGSGNIFGLEQSGYVSKVGLTLYNKILAESIRESQGSTEHTTTPPSVSFVGEALLGEDYMPLVEDRLYYYQQLAETKTKGDFLQIKKEVRDRFGRLPIATKNLFLISESQKSFQFLEPKKIEIENNTVSFVFRSLPKNCGANLFIEKVMGLSKKVPFNVKTKTVGANSLSVNFSGATIKNVVDLCLLFDSLFSSTRAK